MAFHTLVASAHLHQLPINPGQSFIFARILQAAKAYTLKAKSLSIQPSDLVTPIHRQLFKLTMAASLLSYGCQIKSD